MNMWEFLDANANGIGMIICVIAVLLFLVFLAKEIDK